MSCIAGFATNTNFDSLINWNMQINLSHLLVFAVGVHSRIQQPHFHFCFTCNLLLAIQMHLNPNRRHFFWYHDKIKIIILNMMTLKKKKMPTWHHRQCGNFKIFLSVRFLREINFTKIEKIEFYSHSMIISWIQFTLSIFIITVLFSRNFCKKRESKFLYFPHRFIIIGPVCGVLFNDKGTISKLDT